MNTSQNFILDNPEQLFQDFLMSHNHPLDTAVNHDDSKFHRLRCPDGSKTDASYKFFSTEIIIGAYLKCWYCGIEANFSSKQKNEVPAKQWKAHIKRLKEVKQQSEIEKQQSEAAVASLSKLVFSVADTEIAGNHSYLLSKSAPNYGLRVITQEDDNTKKAKCYKGTLVIPCYNANDDQVNLERIYFDNKEEEYKKRPLTDGQWSGSFYFIGKITDEKKPILLVEGYCSGASPFEATGYPTAIAFYCGNIINVAKILRSKYPQAPLVILADDDQWNEKPERRHSGLKAAEHTCAQVHNTTYLLPDFKVMNLPEEKLAELKPTDFNDLVSKLNFSGSKEAALAEIKRQIDEHIKTLKISTKLPPNMRLTKEGLFFDKEDSNGNVEPVLICSEIEITAYLRDVESTNWGRLLEFNDSEGYHHVWGMPMSMLKGSGEELRGELLSRGLELGLGGPLRNKFLEYITYSVPPVFARCVARIGWHSIESNRVFVLPHRTIGQSSEKVVYQTETLNNHFKVKGTIDDWKTNVSKYCIGNSRLVLAVSTAFASMLLELVNEDSGGINFFGTSSAGKTTALLVAGSVYSDPTYLSRWRGTVNGIEALAAARNDCLLTLDELAQVEPKEAGNAIYTLANGTGKARANQYGGARPQTGWRILFLSSGEIDLNQHISDGGKKITAGQQVRCIDIQADAGAGYGIFENLHEFNSGDQLSLHLKEMSAQYYGTACLAFLEEITRPENQNLIIEQFQKVRTQFHRDVETDISLANGQVKRATNRLALIAYAGQLASKYGLTGWETGEAVTASRIALEAWIQHRGGIGNGEQTVLLAQIKGIFEAHGDSRFQDFTSTSLQPLIHNRLGFKKSEITNQSCIDKYYVLPSGFKELHSGFNRNFAINTLKQNGWLEINENGEVCQSIHIPAFGKKTRCYIFTDAIWES